MWGWIAGGIAAVVTSPVFLVGAAVVGVGVVGALIDENQRLKEENRRLREERDRLRSEIIKMRWRGAIIRHVNNCKNTVTLEDLDSPEKIEVKMDSSISHDEGDVILQ